MSNNDTGVGMSASTTAITNKKSDNRLGLHDVFYVECYSEDGTLKWTDEVHNAITDEGIKYIMDTAFYGATGGNQYVENTDWYVGLATASPTDPTYTDTAAALPALMGASVGEYDQYTGGRKLLNLGASGTPSGGTVTNDNSASVAAFTIESPADDVGGCFIVAGTGASTKSGSVTGVLYGAGAFSAGNKVVDTNDTLNVTVSLTAANA